MAHYILRRKDGLSMAGDVHMVAARLDCKRAIVGTKWAASGCMDRLRKHHSHLVGVHFWQERLLGLWIGVYPTESAVYWMLVNEWVRLRSRMC